MWLLLGKQEIVSSLCCRALVSYSFFFYCAEICITSQSYHFCSMVKYIKLIFTFLKTKSFNKLFIDLFDCVGSWIGIFRDLCFIMRDLLLHMISVVVTRGLRCSVACGNLSSPTRDGTSVHCIARQILNHWTTRKVPHFNLF